MKTNRKTACLALATALALSCTLAGAGEVVRFQDGRYLKVEGHQIHGDAVKLMMENRSTMILPRNRIESIRSGQVTVFPATDSHGTAAEQFQAVVRELRPEYPEPGSRKRGRS